MNTTTFSLLHAAVMLTVVLGGAPALHGREQQALRAASAPTESGSAGLPDTPARRTDIPASTGPGRPEPLLNERRPMPNDGERANTPSTSPEVDVFERRMRERREAGAPASRVSEPSARGLRAAAGAVAGTSIIHYTGRAINGAGREPIGVLWDVLADPRSGAVAYVLVSSPGLNRLRVMPFAALRPNDRDGALSVRAQRDALQHLPSIEPREIADGRITLPETVQRSLAAVFPESTAGASELFQLSILRGRQVVTGSETVGTVRDVVIETDRNTAVAVITPHDDFSVAGREFIIPLRELDLAARRPETISTRLTRADFERVSTDPHRAR